MRFQFTPTRVLKARRTFNFTKYSDDEQRDDHGRWTAGAMMAAMAARATISHKEIEAQHKDGLLTRGEKDYLHNSRKALGGKTPTFDLTNPDTIRSLHAAHVALKNGDVQRAKNHFTAASVQARSNHPNVRRLAGLAGFLGGAAIGGTPPVGAIAAATRSATYGHSVGRQIGSFLAGNIAPVGMYHAGMLGRNMLSGGYYRKRLFTDERRKHDAKTGAAMPGGRYPIENGGDLHNAYMDWIRTGRSADVRSHIAERAKALGLASPFEKSLVAEIDFAKERNQPDLEHGLVWGWASVIEKDGKVVTDHDGDRISEEELVKAAHDFMKNCRVSGGMHTYDPDSNEPLKAGDVVESVVLTKELQKALGIDLGKVGWLIGYHVTDPTIRKGIASGKLRALSIGGSGVRIPVAD